MAQTTKGYLLNKVIELLFKLFQYMVNNKRMVCLPFRNESDLMLYETSYVGQTKICIYTLVASYKTNTQNRRNQPSSSLYLQFEDRMNKVPLPCILGARNMSFPAKGFYIFFNPRSFCYFIRAYVYKVNRPLHSCVHLCC